MVNFQKLVEDAVMGGEGSVMGPGVDSTASQFSSDSYAPGDVRKPVQLGGVQTRHGMIKSKKKKSKKKAKK